MNWEIKNEKFTKTFILSGFNEIIDGLDDIRKIANDLDHHPDFEVFDYKKIRFTLFTHSSNSISDLDYQLAKHIDLVYQ